MDFSSGNVFVDTVQRQMNFQETNAQFSDEHNNLLFSSNGVYVANAQDDTMQNGSGLNPSLYTTARSNTGLFMIQANLVIPFPGDSTKFYLFHQTIDDYQNTNTVYFLYYSVIDMTLDNGLGAVIQKNTVLINDTLISGFTATKHANGRDWWVIAQKYLSGVIFKFLVTPTGIQTFSQDMIYGIGWPGQMAFSPNGDKFASYNPNYDDLEIMDFDRCTGMFSNYIQISINDSASVPGTVFSPSGRYLYLSSSGANSAYIYQLDMLAPNIAASKQIIATRDTFFADFSQSAIGPDNKIYIVGAWRSFHVINNPDSAGSASGFCRSCVQLPAYNGFTIPNHPNYFLGPIQGSLCDSLTSDIPLLSSSLPTFNIFPNPSKDVLYIYQDKKEIIKKINIYNYLGQIQKTEYVSIKNDEYIEINISLYSTGIYFLEIFTNKNKIVKRFVKH